jgi:hypothetical protein
MAYRTEDLLQECANRALGTAESNPAQAKRAKLFAMSFPNLSITTFDNVWNAVLHIIRTNAKIKRGTRLPSFGRCVFTKDTKNPFFVMSEAFALPNKITFRQDIKAPELSAVDLNFSKIGQLAKCTKDAAKSIYRELISRLGEVISDANNTVHLHFKGIGILTGNRFDLRFRFESNNKNMKNMRPETTASFSKNAPMTASGLSVVANLADQAMESPAVSARSSRRGGGLGASSSAPILPKIKKGMSITKQIQDQKSSRKNTTSTKKSARKNNKRGPKLNSLVAKKGHDPTYLNFDELKEVNKSLMETQQANDEAQRLSDEEEYRQTVLRLHAEAANEGLEIKKQQERRQEFADAQSLHAQRVEARKFSERNADIEGAEIHWPFSKEEDERKKNEERKKQQAQMLEDQTGISFENLQTKSAMKGPKNPDPSNKDTWYKPSEGNIYPKFLTPSLIPSRIAGGYQTTPVMKLGYQRYATDLKKELGVLKLKESEIANRKQAQEDEIKRRKSLRKKIQASTIKYQAKQVQFDRTRKEEERKRNFLEMDPEPGVAYPLERIHDLHRLDRIKASLRNALDAQVHSKEMIHEMNKTINTAEDNYFLGCVQEQLEIDRAFRLKKKSDEQKALMKTWSKQEAIGEQVKKMEKMRDGLVVRSGARVETIDDVSQVYESLLEDI